MKEIHSWKPCEKGKKKKKKKPSNEQYINHFRKEEGNFSKASRYTKEKIKYQRHLRCGICTGEGRQPVKLPP